MYIFLNVMTVIFTVLTVILIIGFLFSGCDPFAGVLLLIAIFGCLGFYLGSDAYKEAHTTEEIAIVNAVVVEKESIRHTDKQWTDFIITIDVGEEKIEKSVSKWEYDTLEKGQTIKVEHVTEIVFGEAQRPYYRIPRTEFGTLYDE